MGALAWIATVALFFYLTPFLRLLTRPLRALLAPRRPAETTRLHPFLIKIGRLEYLLGPFRDRMLSIILLSIVVYRWIEERPLGKQTLLASSLIVFYNLLAILTIRYRDGIRLKLAEVARGHSNVHPEDFFNLFYIMLGPWPPPFSATGLRYVEFGEADYRTPEAPVRSFRPLLESMLATSTLARMAIMSFKQVGPEYGRDAFDGLARLWGSRIAQLFKARLTTRGSETIPLLEGKTLLLFNHKSYLDFALNFFALGAIRKADSSSPGATRHLRPRFIAAKDHLIDNPILYSWISLGKVIENAGMIFIDRKKGKGWAAMEEAAKKLVTSDVEIAVYPQGTRAYFMQSASGERIDAGYYTTFTKKNWDRPLDHLKSGTSYLILDTLMELHRRGEEELNVLVSGIVGTAIAGPKGSFKIQTQTEIEFRLAPLWVLPTSLAEGLRRPQGLQPQGPEEELYMKRREEIQEGIHQHLLKALNWHELLIQRMERELEKLDLPAQEIEAAIAWLKMSNAEGQALPFILIDRILALKPELWGRFFRLFLSLIGERPEGASWTALLQEVSERLKTR